jgi:hypothetical protein
MLVAAWAWTSPIRVYLWRWYHYTFREPLVEAVEAHKSLREVCGYRLVFTSPHRIISVRPSLKRFRPGLWVVVEPIQQKGKWSQRWTKWVEDPMELWLLRSAVRGVPRSVSQPQVSSRSTFDFISEEMDELLMTPPRRT